MEWRFKREGKFTEVEGACREGLFEERDRRDDHSLRRLVESAGLIQSARDVVMASIYTHDNGSPTEPEIAVEAVVKVDESTRTIEVSVKVSPRTAAVTAPGPQAPKPVERQAVGSGPRLPFAYEVEGRLPNGKRRR